MSGRNQPPSKESWRKSPAQPDALPPTPKQFGSALNRGAKNAFAPSFEFERVTKTSNLSELEKHEILPALLDHIKGTANRLAKGNPERTEELRRAAEDAVMEYFQSSSSNHRKPISVIAIERAMRDYHHGGEDADFAAILEGHTAQSGAVNAAPKSAFEPAKETPAATTTATSEATLPAAETKAAAAETTTDKAAATVTEQAAPKLETLEQKIRHLLEGNLNVRSQVRDYTAKHLAEQLNVMQASSSSARRSLAQHLLEGIEEAVREPAGGLELLYESGTRGFIARLAYTITTHRTEQYLDSHLHNLDIVLPDAPTIEHLLVRNFLDEKKPHHLLQSLHVEGDSVRASNIQSAGAKISRMARRWYSSSDPEKQRLFAKLLQDDSALNEQLIGHVSGLLENKTFSWTNSAQFDKTFEQMEKSLVALQAISSASFKQFNLHDALRKLADHADKENKGKIWFDEGRGKSFANVQMLSAEEREALRIAVQKNLENRQIIPVLEENGRLVIEYKGSVGMAEELNGWTDTRLGRGGIPISPAEAARLDNEATAGLRQQAAEAAESAAPAAHAAQSAAASYSGASGYSGGYGGYSGGGGSASVTEKVEAAGERVMESAGRAVEKAASRAEPFLSRLLHSPGKVAAAAGVGAGALAFFSNTTTGMGLLKPAHNLSQQKQLLLEDSKPNLNLSA